MSGNNVTQNRLGGHAVTWNTSNGTYALTDFATTDLVSNTENVKGVSITNIIWGGGPWTIARGSNVVFTTDGQSGDIDLAARGISLSMYSNATIVVNTANAAATLILKVSKNVNPLNPAF